MKRTIIILISCVLLATALLLCFRDGAVKAGQYINSAFPALERLWGGSEAAPGPDPLAGLEEFSEELRELLKEPEPEPVPEPSPEPEPAAEEVGFDEYRVSETRAIPRYRARSKYKANETGGAVSNGFRGRPTTVEEYLALPVPDFAPDAQTLVFKDEQWLEAYEGNYYLIVNYTANTVTVYAGEDEGSYNVPAKVFVCSAGYDTPRYGYYELGVQKRWVYLFGNVYGQYSTEICEDILFHSVPYKKLERPDTLEYEEFDKLGTAASAGCIRLQVIDAKWIFDNYDRITGVQFISDEDPGPLGKPEAMKISDNKKCRGWDPTDPDEKNPWIAVLADK